MVRPRHGFALIDAVAGGVMLGIGLAVILSLASRSITTQAVGQKQMVAAWLVDELLGSVVMEGPVLFPQRNATNGRFDAPFDEFEFDVRLEDLGLNAPFQVTAVVRWQFGSSEQSVQAQTYIARREGDLELPADRIPSEPIDRIERYYQDEEDAAN